MRGSAPAHPRPRVAAINPTTNRVAAERLDDGARVYFEDDYLREHVGLSYAVTVHSAQGVTADTSHAVLGETTNRALLYVAMTRGRLTNTAQIYQRPTGDHEYGVQEPDGTHVKYRGSSHDVAGLVRGILANTTSLQSPHTTTPLELQRQHCPSASGASWSDEGRP